MSKLDDRIKELTAQIVVEVQDYEASDTGALKEQRRLEASIPLQVTIKEAYTMMRYSRTHFYKIMDVEGGIRTEGRGRLRRVAVSELKRYQEEQLKRGR